MSTSHATIKKQKGKLATLETETSNAYNKLKRLRRMQKLNISDHAMLRYLERIEKVNIEGLQNKILTPELIDYYTKLGDGTYPINNGELRVVINDGIVVTILN